MVGIEDVARLARVSTASVSRVLAGKSVGDELRGRVLQAVEQLGYRPNRVARSLRSNKSTTLGLIVADIQNPYFTQVCRAVEDAASRAGYAVFLCNSDENPEKESRYIGVLRDENVVGTILAPTAKTQYVPDPIGARKMPVVFIDRPVSRLAVDTVVVDNVAAATELTAHLLAHGRRRIAGMFGANSATGRERHQGFVAAHAALGLQPVDALIRFVPPREQEGFLVAAELLRLPFPPDALLTSNGLLAAGGFRALLESRFHCPEEIAMASFDNTSWSQLVRPAMTVIEQPTYEIGQTATELLLARIEDPSRATRNVTLRHSLVVRRSCGCTADPTPDNAATL